jgi:hypothetical protein
MQNSLNYEVIKKLSATTVNLLDNKHDKHANLFGILSHNFTSFALKDMNLLPFNSRRF